MATSQDANGEDSTDIENAADAADIVDGLDVKALLDAQYEAIEENGEQIMRLIKVARLQAGVDGDASDQVQQEVRALMHGLMNECDNVGPAEAAEAMWSELLVISSQFAEDTEESEAADDGEANATADADGEGGDEQASLDDIAAMAGSDGDDGDDSVSESGATHDPAFQ